MNRNSLKVVNWRIRLKQKLIEYKGGKCSRCPYSKDCPTAYHFHHRDPEQKEFQISGSTLGFERLKAEVDKCDMVCANCHAEIHDQQWVAARERAKLKRKPRIPVEATGCRCLAVNQE